MNVKLFRRSDQKAELNISSAMQRKISWTYSTIKPAIWITLNGWISIVFLVCLIIWPHNDYVMSIDTFDKIFGSKRNDFLVIHMIIVFILHEYFWYHFLLEVIHYKSAMNDFFINNWQYDDQQLSPQHRNYLIQFFRKSQFMAVIFLRCFIIGLLAIQFIFSNFSFDLFESYQINLTKLVLSSTLFFSYNIQCIYFIGNVFKSISFTVFIMEFFIVRLKQLSSKSALILQNSFQSSIKVQKLFWYRFHYEYVTLYSEMAIFNLTARNILFFIELLSKSSVVICLLFISQQTKMNIQITFVALAFILYFRVAHMPSYNRICWLSIHRWIARTQWLSMQRNVFTNSFPLRYSLKSRLFVQTMTNNLFGFTCGRMFFISKFKYIQIFLFINDYHNNVSTIRILPNRLECLYVVTATWSFHVCGICESNFHILMTYPSIENAEIKFCIRRGFEIIKFYNLRINYDLFDYQQRKISWTYSTIKPAIWITLNGWISIVFLVCLIIWPHNDYVMSIDIFDEIVGSQRNDFIGRPRKSRGLVQSRLEKREA
ncbi:hypothetical protein DERF_006536 [Dermatophagoides farinae]|uniref:Uncharacterized protein n=1 Tax=Dermatophagoides farinae TaxID=6954 RepID=A0A922L874_DERFA|nr:hypothetical protein DERF_006536 [Dermatophagoides farinae]